MPKPKPAKLTPEQVEIVAEFSYHSFGYFISRSFDQVVRKVLPEGFGMGPSVKRFEREAKEAFDRERGS